MAKRNPIPTIDDECEYVYPTGEICGTPYACSHEVFFGTANRRISIEQGFQEKLCVKHHNTPGEKCPHHDKETDLALKRKHQARYEENHTRESFYKLIGRNYL